MKLIIILSILISGHYLEVRSGVSVSLQSLPGAVAERAFDKSVLLEEKPCHISEIETSGVAKREFAEDTSITNPRYDAGLAKKLDAYDYGLQRLRHCCKAIPR